MRKKQHLSIGDEIESRRKKKDLMMCELAARVGISNGYLNDIEKGRRTPSMTVAVKIAKALGCTVDDLLKAG